MSTYRPGDIIDHRYLIEAHLGSGGFADVFKAKDEMTGATIAIKIYNSMDASGVAIFQKEYLKMSDVHHSRLLTAHHFGVHESCPYLIMPFCKHGNLTQLLIDEDNYLSERKLATILLQVSEGLEYLHKHGIVHQDIKPDNILEKKEEEYVLSDFGISQRARSTLQKSIRRTEKMGSQGSGYTPAYAPPARERLSTRAAPSKDIFSLGATLYELSAKELPYRDMGEAVERNFEIPYVEQGYSPGWNQLLQSCLSLEPEARPTATELKQMAQQFLAQGVWTFPKREKASSPQAQSPPSRKQKSAAPATPTKEAKSSGSKRGWLLALLAIPVVAGLGWGVFQMFGPGRAVPDEPDIVPDTIVSPNTPNEEDPIATPPPDTPATLANPPAEETAAEPNQQQYDDIIASAERNYRRGNYEISLGKFESAKGLVSDDQAAIDGIAKCEQKIADLDEERQRQATAAEEAAERQRQAEAANQKRYDDLIASAERDYSRGDYQSSLDKFESARGKVSNDQAAIDGIAKSEQKLEEAEKLRQEYDAIIASAERDYSRGNYQSSLDLFERARGLVSADQAARDGIAKCERKLEAAAAAAERKRKAAASYRTVRLNGQTWLAQNLNYDTGSGSWCYDNDPANCRKYGRLYTWAAAKKACAALGSGWRLPTDREWREMAKRFGGADDDASDGGKAAYKALLDGGSSGFKALLGGQRDVGGSFYGRGSYGQYWSGTEADAPFAWGYGFSSDFRKLSRYGLGKAFGVSCRCLKDN